MVASRVSGRPAGGGDFGDRTYVAPSGMSGPMFVVTPRAQLERIVASQQKWFDKTACYCFGRRSFHRDGGYRGTVAALDEGAAGTCRPVSGFASIVVVGTPLRAPVRRAGWRQCGLCGTVFGQLLYL